MKEIARIDKNALEEVVINLVNYKGYDLVDLRVWIRSVTGETLKPTKKGISVKPDLLPQLIEALKRAEDTYREAEKEEARV